MDHPLFLSSVDVNCQILPSRTRPCSLKTFLGAPSLKGTAVEPLETCQKRVQTRIFEKFSNFLGKLTVRSVIVGSGENLRAMKWHRPNFFVDSHYRGSTSQFVDRKATGHLF